MTKGEGTKDLTRYWKIMRKFGIWYTHGPPSSWRCLEGLLIIQKIRFNFIGSSIAFSHFWLRKDFKHTFIYTVPPQFTNSLFVNNLANKQNHLEKFWFCFWTQHWMMGVTVAVFLTWAWTWHLIQSHGMNSVCELKYHCAHLYTSVYACMHILFFIWNTSLCWHSPCAYGAGTIENVYIHIVHWWRRL